jgi:hypothetical protein
MFEAKCSASPTPWAETVSRIVLCLPEILSNQSSSACRAACHGPSNGGGDAAAEESTRAATPNAASATPTLEKNDRRAGRHKILEGCMSTSFGSPREPAAYTS